MAQWKSISIGKKQVVNTYGDGINTGVPVLNVADSELTYCMDMGSQNYPVISTRYGRTYYSSSMPTISSPDTIGERNNSVLHVVDGNTWKYWNEATTAFVTITNGLTAGQKSEILDYNAGTVRYTVLMNSVEKKIWDGTNAVATLGDANTPNTNIFVCHRGRIFAAYGTNIYHSGANLPNDWTTLNDAGIAGITAAKSDITGLAIYNARVVAFTEYSMHELYGNQPTNYVMVDIEGEIGCISNRSIVKCNKKLYWAWHDGIYEYNGASPVKVSRAVEKYFKGISYTNRTKIVSGSIGDFLYISIPYKASTNNMLLVFDTRIGKWYLESGSFVNFTTIKNNLYGIDTSGKIHNMRDTALFTDNGSPIAWEMITKAYHENAMSQKKTLSHIDLVYSAAANATMNIGYTTDINSTTFTNLVSSEDFDLNGEETNSKFLIPVSALQNVDWYKFQIKGTGDVTIHGLERNYRVRR